MAESEEELKSLLMGMKEESEKAALKLNIQKTKIMAPGHITSWQIEGKWVEEVTDTIFLSSKIIGDWDYSHEFIRHLLIWKKAMKKPRQLVKKQRHHFSIKDTHSQSYSFSSSCAKMWELDHKEDWMCAKLLQLCLTPCDYWPLLTATFQAPLSIGFSRQEYWSGLHALLQGIFPTQWSKLHLFPSAWQAGSLPLVATWEAQRRLSATEMMFSICGAGRDSWESLGLKGDKINQS